MQVLVRDLDRIPVLHVLLHSVQSDQTPNDTHPPLTAVYYNNILLNTEITILIEVAIFRQIT